MHRAALLPVIIIAAVAIGGLLYLYGGPAFHQTYTNVTDGKANSFASSDSNIVVIARGTNAAGVDARTNYRITNEEQLAALWQSIYTDNGASVPTIDFTKYEVLGLFDGSHSTDGYDISLASLKDTSSARVVTITHIEPGDSCTPTSSRSSPFILIKVSKSSLPLSRVDESATRECQ